MKVTFEARRFYVAPRKSVLFFARLGDQRVRCYVEQHALIEPERALREDADAYRCSLLAFDHHRDLIQATARRLIADRGDRLDNALVLSRTSLALKAETVLAALEARGS